LGGVLRELRQAEKRAKAIDGKDAFSITLLKRAGGRRQLTLPWLLNGGEGDSTLGSPMGVLIALRNAFSDKDMSRRAAYLIQDWVRKLPPPDMVGGEEGFKQMLSANVSYQFRRQCKGSSRYDRLAAELAEVAFRAAQRASKKDEREAAYDFLTIAEFLAREGRAVPSAREEEANA
jgi:CRISPR-associated protein Cmr2